MKNFRGSALAAGVGTPESVPHELLGSSLRFYLVFKHRDCFQVDDTIVDPSFFELFLETKAFKDEMEIRLEGSVRRCLSFEALCEIHLPRPALLVQRSISDKIGNISSKIKLEDRILRAYIRQKEWLLKQMFI